MTRLILTNAIAVELTIAGAVPAIVYGTAYNATVRTYGGIGAVTLSCTGTLPTGITFTDNGDGTGTLAGTSTDSGDFPVVIDAEDSERTTASKAYTLTVQILPITVTGDAGDMNIGDSDTFSYGVSGGSGTYTNYAIASGALPAGWVLDAGTGVIARDPTTLGSYAWTIVVTDSLGNFSAPYADSATIDYPTLTLTGTLADAEVSHPYSSDLVIAGGDGTYSNARITAGSLAAGLALSIVNVSGTYKVRVSGTPTASMVPDTITIAVDSGDGQTAYSAQSFNDYSVISLSGTFASPLYDGVAYSQSIAIGGGSGGYNNPRVATGALPTGLALSVVGSTVVLSGTCSAGTTFNFTVAVDDSLGYTATSAAQSLTRQDQYFANVVALLHCEGANGSTTVTDQTGKSWATGGGVAVTTAQHYEGSGSLHFNGTNEYRESPSSSDFNFGSGNWVIEIAFRPTDFAASGGVQRTPICINNATGNYEVRIAIDTSGKVRFYVYDGGYKFNLTSSGSLTLNSFANEIKFVRSGSNHYLYINGTKDAQVGSASYTLSVATPKVTIGHPGFSSGGYFAGELDEIRITKGTDRGYTGATVPTQQDAFPNS